MKFKRKEQIIEAIQWFPGVKIDCVMENTPICCTEEHPCEPYGKVRVDEVDEEYVLPGDWIVIDPDGFGYPYSDTYIRNNFDRVVVPFQYAGDSVYPDTCTQQCVGFGSPANVSYIPYEFDIAYEPPNAAFDLSIPNDPAGYMQIDPTIKEQLDRLEKKINILLRCKGLLVED